jgi:hypothetical protein
VRRFDVLTRPALERDRWLSLITDVNRDRFSTSFLARLSANFAEVDCSAYEAPAVDPLPNDRAFVLLVRALGFQPL